jgi:cytochrome c oxidase subunit 1
MNQVILNTMWVPGHFHMTVGTAVAFTLMGVAYWLIPYLTGRGLYSRRLALASSWTYAIGILIFARGMISGGLHGMPRRTFMAEATYYSPAWRLPGILTGIGGSLMFVGVMLFFLVIGLTIVAGQRGEQPADIPVSETLTAPALSGWEPRLDRLGWWMAATVLLIVIAYGPFSSFIRRRPYHRGSSCSNDAPHPHPHSQRGCLHSRAQNPVWCSLAPPFLLPV